MKLIEVVQEGNNKNIEMESFLFPHEVSQLSTVAAHKNVECIERFFNKDFPYYIAIHKVTNANEPKEYTELHKHKEAEINILISDDENFKYKIVIGKETKIVGRNVSIYIPAGVLHSANVISGSGYYIAIRL